ncbi:hypothetical protein FEF09_28285 [Chitinophaga pinensis]|uniref:Uncharacterized protein n=1 Tax=Chitinophaga pinensis TaxID=79329 RepID=A0A5C6LJ69_9BACT|nr:hypothetical protein FEF09_28285 [Chitinophaga pinensis]
MIKVWFFLAALLLFVIIDISAQSHVATAGSFCRYAKNSLRNKNIYAEGHTQCPACDAEDAKEAIARKAEDKRRADVRAAEQAAKILMEKQAQETALKNKRAADKGVTELAVTMSANKPNTGTPTKKAAVVVNGMIADRLYDEAETDNHLVSYMILTLTRVSVITGFINCTGTLITLCLITRRFWTMMSSKPASEQEDPIWIRTTRTNSHQVSASLS